jgi:hypothetical protein
MMAIIPDEKDWTWVLTTPCPECGYLGADVDPHGVAEGLRANSRAWRGLLDHASARVRPSDDRWSAVEYGCHVRDVFRRFQVRLACMLEEDDPTFENWDQDATAIELRYAEQDAATVVPEIEEAGAVLADQFAAVPTDAWARPGRRSDGAQFTVATLGQYLLHDPVHHVWDVQQGYRRL